MKKIKLQQKNRKVKNSKENYIKLITCYEKT